MNERALHDSLQASLEALARGEDTVRLLKGHPDQAPDLRSALETAQLLRQQLKPRDPSSSAMARSRARVMAALPSHHRTRFLPRSRIIPRFAGALAAALLAAAAGMTGLAVASAQALPDSPLYFLKRYAEAARLELTVGSRARIALQETYANHRADEVRQLLAQGRMARVAFEGAVQSQDGTVWFVDEIPIDISPEAYRTPGIERAMTVLVQGQTQTNGRFLAQAIYLVGFYFSGRVSDGADGLGLWKIGQRWILVTGDTLVDPRIRLGDVVSVSVRVENEDRLVAREIIRLELSFGDVPAPADAEPPARTQVPDGDEGRGRGQGSGDEEEIEEPEDEETTSMGNDGSEEEEEPEEVEEPEEEEGEKEGQSQNKGPHGGG